MPPHQSPLRQCLDCSKKIANTYFDEDEGETEEVELLTGHHAEEGESSRHLVQSVPACFGQVGPVERPTLDFGEAELERRKTLPVEGGRSQVVGRRWSWNFGLLGDGGDVGRLAGDVGGDGDLPWD